MSIKEALGRARRPYRISSTSFNDGSVNDFNPYRAIAEENCSKILKEARIHEILADFKETIKEKYPDVEIGNFKLNSQLLTAAADVTWNGRPKDGNMYEYDFFSILIRPGIEEIAIRSTRVASYIAKDRWNGHPEVIEDAIVKAYNNPGKLISNGYLKKNPLVV